EATSRNLELTRTIQGGRKKGSLLGLLDRTTTAMGGRTLARLLAYPLLDLPSIELRLDAVEELHQRGVLREELQGILRALGDWERLLGGLPLGAGRAGDLRGLAVSLAQLPSLRRQLASCRAGLLASLLPALEGLDDLAEELGKAVVDEPPPT